MHRRRPGAICTGQLVTTTHPADTGAPRDVERVVSAPSNPAAFGKKVQPQETPRACIKKQDASQLRAGGSKRWSLGVRLRVPKEAAGLSQLLTLLTTSTQHGLVFLLLLGRHRGPGTASSPSQIHLLKRERFLCPFILWGKCVSTVTSGMLPYLFYIFLCISFCFGAVLGLRGCMSFSLDAVSGSYSLDVMHSAKASHYGGFSCCGSQA